MCRQHTAQSIVITSPLRRSLLPVAVWGLLQQELQCVSPPWELRWPPAKTRVLSAHSKSYTVSDQVPHHLTSPPIDQRIFHSGDAHPLDQYQMPSAYELLHTSDASCFASSCNDHAMNSWRLLEKLRITLHISQNQQKSDACSN